MSHSGYRPIPMSARQSCTLLRTTPFEACCVVDLNGFAVSTQACTVKNKIAKLFGYYNNLRDYPSCAISNNVVVVKHFVGG